MYRVSLHGPQAIAHWSCRSIADATAMMKRWRQAVSRSGDGRIEPPDDWQLSIEGQDGEGHWTLIAYFGGRRP
jgi:hypothetical protein